MKPITDVDKYQELCACTENLDFETIRKRICEPGVRNLLAFHLQFAVQNMKDVDALKKYIFYGKQPAKGFPSAPEVSRLDKDNLSNDLENSDTMRRLHAVIGILTEGGELSELMYNQMFKAMTVDRETWLKEFGDPDWYISAGVGSLNAKRSEETTLNIQKLAARYPNKFSEEIARQHDGH